MRFRPCIDLHQGKVKQIVGSTLCDLGDGGQKHLQTNFEARHSARWFARLYQKDNLCGGHIIQLGPGNRKEAEDALAAWPGGMQLGGGVTLENAAEWLAAGASAVIVTSWVFHDGMVDLSRLRRLSASIGKKRLVLDLSCRRRGRDYYVVTNRWQTYTQEKVNEDLLDKLAGYCDEFLIHAVDVEGKCGGIEKPLVSLLGRWSGAPITYAGGVHCRSDIEAIDTLGRGALDFTVGSALDLFGGSGLTYAGLVRDFGPAAAKPEKKA